MSLRAVAQAGRVMPFPRKNGLSAEAVAWRFLRALAAGIAEGWIEATDSNVYLSGLALGRILAGGPGFVPPVTLRGMERRFAAAVIAAPHFAERVQKCPTKARRAAAWPPKPPHGAA